MTAQDFVYSLERAASPELQSDTALTYLGDIVGIHKFASGQVEHIEGVKALDEHTLQITIDAPKPYFLLTHQLHCIRTGSRKMWKVTANGIVTRIVYFEAGDHEALVHISGAQFGNMLAGRPHGRFTHHV